MPDIMPSLGFVISRHQDAIMRSRTETKYCIVCRLLAFLPHGATRGVGYSSLELSDIISRFSNLCLGHRKLKNSFMYIFLQLCNEHGTILCANRALPFSNLINSIEAHQGVMFGCTTVPWLSNVFPSQVNTFFNIFGNYSIYKQMNSSVIQKVISTCQLIHYNDLNSLTLYRYLNVATENGCRQLASCLNQKNENLRSICFILMPVCVQLTAENQELSNGRDPRQIESVAVQCSDIHNLPDDNVQCHYERAHFPSSQLQLRDSTILIHVPSATESLAAPVYDGIEVGLRQQSWQDTRPLNSNMSAAVVSQELLRFMELLRQRYNCKRCRQLEPSESLQPCGHALCTVCSYSLGLRNQSPSSPCPFCGKTVSSTIRFILQ